MFTANVVGLQILTAAMIKIKKITKDTFTSQKHVNFRHLILLFLMIIYLKQKKKFVVLQLLEHFIIK